jgi:hypothetical protein
MKNGKTAKAKTVPRKTGADNHKGNGKPLTPKQQEFVNQYLIDFNATNAYRRAGYKASNDNSAAAAAARLLRAVKVQAAIQEAMKARSQRTDVTADDVAIGHVSIASSVMPPGTWTSCRYSSPGWWCAFARRAPLCFGQSMTRSVASVASRSTGPACTTRGPVRASVTRRGRHLADRRTLCHLVALLQRLPRDGGSGIIGWQVPSPIRGVRRAWPISTFL